MKTGAEQYNFWEVYYRILRFFNVATQAQVADIMGVSQAAVNASAKRRVIPDTWLLRLVMRHGLNPAWILWGGEYKQFLLPSDEAPDENNRRKC